MGKQITKTFIIDITTDIEKADWKQFSDDSLCRCLKEVIEENSYGIDIKANVKIGAKIGKNVKIA